MSLKDYPLISGIVEDVGKRLHDYYRCYKCNRVITREEEREVWAEATAGIMAENKVSICKCGSGKYSPALPVDEEWRKPNVLIYTVKLILARAVAPWLEKNEPEGLPHLEWLIGSKLLEDNCEVAWPLVESVIAKKAEHTAEREKKETENGPV